ncbi:MAG: exo-alpha-sialidase, partial [Planctomycetaceae bacterium]|nr:exo-alpha-sialidase [Planctomycetaceae bacterium]
MKFALTLCLHLFLVASLTTAAEPLVPTGWDAALAGDQVLERLIPVTGKQVKGAHDAEMVLLDDRAFIVAEVNDTRAGESAGWPEIYCALSIVNLKTLKVEAVIPFARSSQKFANETLPVGACFVPRILKHGENTLRCFFASEQPGKRQAQTWYIDFDLPARAFENKIHKVKLKTAAGTFDMQPQYFHADAVADGFRKPARDFGFYLFDSFKNWGDQTYIAINNFAGKQNALARINDRHDTVEVLGHYNEPQSAQLSESAVNRLPDGTWMAICRNDGGDRNYYFTTSSDGINWTQGSPVAAVPNGTNSKPTFDKFGDVYYLGWQEATRIDGVNRSVFNIDVSLDGKTWQRKYRFETPHSFQYPAFAEYEGAIWLCVTQGDHSPSRKERIMFGRLE